MIDFRRDVAARYPVKSLLIALAILTSFGGTVVLAEEFEPVTTTMLENPDASDWLMLGRTYDEQRFSPLDEINRSNVSDLRMAWTRGLPAGSGRSRNRRRGRSTQHQRH